MLKKENHLKTTDTETPLIPQLTLDCIILGFHAGQLRVLLLRWKDTQEWSLPGGPIYQTESLDDAAYRVLKERTCLDQIFLQQFHVFGELPRYDLSEIREKLKHVVDPGLWYERAISVGYYALVDYSKVSPNPDQYTDECRWWNIEEVPRLLFDHNHIIDQALKALRVELSLQPIGYNLLPDKFTMPELQRLYETMLGKPLDPRNFYKKMTGLGILERLKERKRGGAHKAPYLYRFNKAEYEAKLKEGNLSFL
uniref:NUDIX domain-containing protein n=1 Tax=Roseihalotalea indica TaxID=2867963 RepID=A0AA49JFG7_9BACT|nr:NUDIX domain-containing protein [Tunicatimonas sp. TK19036]